MDANFQTGLLASQSAAIRPPQATANAAKADKAAKDFESVFIGQFLGSMFDDIPTDGLTGGGQGEQMFRSLLVDQYAKSVEQQGGFGLAASVKAELLKHQQISQGRIGAQ